MLPQLGLSEIFVIALVALIFLRPEDLPKLMHRAGLFWVQLQANWSGILQGLQERR